MAKLSNAKLPNCPKPNLKPKCSMSLSEDESGAHKITVYVKYTGDGSGSPLVEVTFDAFVSVFDVFEFAIDAFVFVFVFDEFVFVFDVFVFDVFVFDVFVFDVFVFDVFVFVFGVFTFVFDTLDLLSHRGALTARRRSVMMVDLGEFRRSVVREERSSLQSAIQGCVSW